MLIIVLLMIKSAIDVIFLYHDDKKYGKSSLWWYLQPWVTPVIITVIILQKNGIPCFAGIAAVVVIFINWLTRMIAFRERRKVKETELGK